MIRLPAIFPTAFLLLLTGSLASIGCSPARAPVSDASVDRAARTITAEAMQERISVLAADSLGGRDTPSPGLEAAASYLADEYRSMGLEPAGDGGSYLQRYPFLCRRPDAGGEAQPGGRCSLPADVPDAERAGFEASEPPNVVAILRGTDPVLRSEHVILSAHLDHLGVGSPTGGDSIHNGADDNASGTSALVEVARALSRLDEGPRRSVVFLHVSGEEDGLLGSRWYSENPTVDLDAVAANVNVDMISSDLHRDTVVVIGKEYSSLGTLVDEVAAGEPELGLVASDDIWPEERLFFRSDHFNFVRREIPAVFFFTGLHECYHRPCDELDFVDPDKAARVARLLFHTVLEIANRDRPPVWDPDGLEEVRALTGM